MALEGYTPKLCTVDEASRGLEIAYRRMERFSEDSLGYQATEKTVGQYIADLHFALFATTDERADLEAHYNNGQENGQTCEPQIVTVSDSRL